MTARQTIRGAALDAIVHALRDALDVQRCTLRLPAEDELFPVIHESCTAAAGSLIGESSVALRGQPVVEALLGGADQVVQSNTRTASDEPAFLRMLERYGGMGAQIVTAVRDGDRLLGIISAHQLGAPREWSKREIGLAGEAAALIAALLGTGADAEPTGPPTEPTRPDASPGSDASRRSGR